MWLVRPGDRRIRRVTTLLPRPMYFNGWARHFYAIEEFALSASTKYPGCTQYVWQLLARHPLDEDPGVLRTYLNEQRLYDPSLYYK